MSPQKVNFYLAKLGSANLLLPFSIDFYVFLKFSEKQKIKVLLNRKTYCPMLNRFLVLLLYEFFFHFSANSANGDSHYSENGDSSLKLKTFDHPTAGTISRSPIPPIAICDWLKKVGLSQYGELFKRNGFLYVHEIQDLNEENLAQIGLSNQKHLKKLMTSLNSNMSPKHAIDSSNYAQSYTVA